MNNLSPMAKVYVLGTILIGLGLTGWMVADLNWSNAGLYLLSTLGAVAQTLKVEGPDDKTNYSIAWFVYGFAFVALGAGAAIFVVVVSHLAEWAWHRYPWYIQGFNIGAHVTPVFLAGLAFEAISRGLPPPDLGGALGLIAANLIFVFANHFLVGMVVKLARGHSFAESGVFGFFALFLDFTVLSMGAVTVLIWRNNPLASLLNILPLYLLYHAIRVPALKRQVDEMQKNSDQQTLTVN